MYFAIAYDLWPHLTGRALADLRLMRIPALAVVPRHDRDHVPLALCRHPRHAAPHGLFRFRQSGVGARGVAGRHLGRRAAILLVSGLLFLVILARGQVAPLRDPGAYRFSQPCTPPTTVPLGAQ